MSLIPEKDVVHMLYILHNNHAVLNCDHVLEIIDLHASSAFCMLRYLFLKSYFCAVAFAMLVYLHIDYRVYSVVI